MVILAVSVLFSLYAFGFSAKQTQPEDRWRGPVFSVFAFVFWTAMAQVHNFVAADFGATGLISLSMAWYVLGIFFLIYTVALTWQILEVKKQEDKWTVK